MTTLDQALIKACARQNTRPALAPTPPSRSGADVSDGSHASTSASTPASEVSFSFDPAVASPAVPPPHLAAPAEPPHKPAASPWRAMLQVDAFVWPASWDRLKTTADRQMKQLTDGLAAILQQGRKVLGLASCDTGEGVTTLLAAAGRCLAERGLRVVLLDLNPARPYLAQFLGLLPQAGWEDVVAGRLPPEEVVIESLGDHLAVLPACRPAEPPATEPAAAESSVAAALETLAAHYDAVLLDLGPLEGDCPNFRGHHAERGPENGTVPLGGPLSEAVRRRLDAVVLVHNVRSTTPNRLTDLEVSLAAAGIACAGIVENFVAR